LSHKNNDSIYTAVDIEKYHKGMLSAKQMHALEKAALDDPFLADALEGYTVSGVNSNDDIAELKNRLKDRIEKETKVVPITTDRKPGFSWWKIAAMIVIIAGAGFIVYQIGFNNKKKDIAQTVAKEKSNNAVVNNSVKEDSPASLFADSVSKSVETNQQPDALASKLAEPGSTASANKKTPVAKADDLGKDEKEIAISETAAPVNLPPVRNEEVALDDHNFKKRSVKAEAYAKKNQDAKQDSIIGYAQKTAPHVTPGAVIDKAKQQQQNKAFNQTNVFRGRVTDAQNNALPFSNITNTEDNIGTYSDARGNFVLTSPDSILNVQVSSVGFETNQVQLQNNVPTNNVLLQQDRSLAEVVITNKKVNSNRLRKSNMTLEEPEPADGWNNYDLYLANNLKSPDEYKSKPSDIQGEVELSFEVDKNGMPFNITVKKSLCESCDKEAIRLVKEGPKWTRKAKKGKATVKIAF
jgi:hypothetical protein